ncbi:hypothetical protein VN97_g7065 [Penicillium thymicola]|uniref:Uncharacterized protein n=1 Tax=Penicillium thymicola TaxID=293382 RepID=A0AAI9X7Q4_PENTH|nr:hypothetical protein VN97_g7065 [Penicillium thymicola]
MEAGNVDRSTITYVPDNAWHLRPFPFCFNAHLLPLFDLKSKTEHVPEYPDLIMGHYITNVYSYGTTISTGTPVPVTPTPTRVSHFAVPLSLSE